MIYGKNDILSYFRKQSKKYFAVYKRGTENSGNPIHKNMTSDEEEMKNMDSETALRDFEEVLSWLKSGDYTVMVNDRPKVSERGGNRAEFRITLEESLQTGARDVANSVSGVSGGYSIEDVMNKAKVMALEEFEKLQAKKEAEELRKKVTDLEKELKEANAKVDDPFNKFVGALAPHAEPIIAGLMGGGMPQRAAAAPFVGTAVSGVKPDLHLVDNATAEEIDQHAQQVFEEFVTALQTSRPNDWLEILRKLTVIIQENPKKFEMALTFL